jgi:hypothetical protein
VILATDAQECPAPFPGWTLPGVLTIAIGTCVIVVNTLTDMAYGLVDPRVKYT